MRIPHRYRYYVDRKFRILSDFFISRLFMIIAPKVFCFFIFKFSVSFSDPLNWMETPGLPPKGKGGGGWGVYSPPLPTFLLSKKKRKKDAIKNENE